jgi:hypothetical protein
MLDVGEAYDLTSGGFSVRTTIPGFFNNHKLLITRILQSEMKLKYITVYRVGKAPAFQPNAEQ